MRDKYGIETHKLMLHPCRVCEWLEEGDTFPIFVEICPINACNHFCTFCAYNYLEFTGAKLDYDVLTNTLDDMAMNGLKAVDWDAQGEPLMHPRMPDILNYAKSIGLDNGLETNGVLLTKEIAEKCLHSCTYAKFSIDAATPETHYKIHRGRKDDFEKIIKNIQDCVDLNTGCTIGAQMLLLKENEDEAHQFVDMMNDIGVDWVAIKPFSKHPLQDDSLVHPGDFNKVKDIKNAIVRGTTASRLEYEREYDTCYGINFLSNIDAHGNVTICNTLTGRDDWVLGNIYKDKFSNIWKNRKIREYPVSECVRKICKMDKPNAYLWKLKHPHPHVNFI